MAAVPSLVPQLTYDDLLQPGPRCKPAWTVFSPCSRATTRRLLHRLRRGVAVQGAAQVGRAQGPAPAGQQHELGVPPAVLCGGQPLVQPAVPGKALAGGGAELGTREASCWWTRPTCPSRGCTRWA